MAQGQVNVGDTALLHRPGRSPGEMQTRFAGLLDDNLHLVPTQPVRPTERFGKGFLGGEPGRLRALWQTALGRGEHLLHQPRVADQRVLPPLQVADVHADADNHVVSLAARDQAASAGSC